MYKLITALWILFIVYIISMNKYARFSPSSCYFSVLPIKREKAPQNITMVC